MNKLKLAACGIDCNECGSYKVTMEHDIKAAEGLVTWYRGKGWIGKNEGKHREPFGQFRMLLPQIPCNAIQSLRPR